MIRMTALDQLFFIVTKCTASTYNFVNFISLLFSSVEVRREGGREGGGGREYFNTVHVHMYMCESIFHPLCAQTVARDHAPTSGEFFRLLARSESPNCSYSILNTTCTSLLPSPLLPLPHFPSPSIIAHLLTYSLPLSLPLSLPPSLPPSLPHLLTSPSPPSGC